MKDYNVLDTRAFEKFTSSKDELISRYSLLTEEYDSVVNYLSTNWKGKGADAFIEDAEKVRTNIIGIKETLNMMCDILSDCLEIYTQCDVSLGKANEEAIK